MGDSIDERAFCRLIFVMMKNNGLEFTKRNLVILYDCRNKTMRFLFEGRHCRPDVGGLTLTVKSIVHETVFGLKWRIVGFNLICLYGLG